ncbi:hypothetical protein ACXR6G_14025 [Ancylomarina sp. YFZ004]
MNKEQEKRAEEIIKCLKSHNGKTSFEVINNGFINETMSNTISILEFLGELDLVEDMGNKLFRLTIKGTKFKSFSSLSWRIKSIAVWKIIAGMGVILGIFLGCLQLYDWLEKNKQKPRHTKETIKSEISNQNNNHTSKVDSLKIEPIIE